MQIPGEFHTELNKDFARVLRRLFRAFFRWFRFGVSGKLARGGVLHPREKRLVSDSMF